MERYNVRGREDIVDFISEALERSGAKILDAPSPKTAPFEYRILTPSGEILDLICYAFRANKYRQGGRSSDEHRLQMKYGSDSDGYHDIYIPDARNRVTLMFGVHIEEGVIVAVDPIMHKPTRFFKSIEFKTRHIEEIHNTGWCGWERDRREARRDREMPLLSFQTEVLLGFQPDRFLRYVQLERIATGMDPGERLLLIDRLADKRQHENEVLPHPLEIELGLSARQILDMIEGAFRLKTAVRGSAAEHHLEEHLRTVNGIDEVIHLDADGQPDFKVRYKGGSPIRIECKNVLRRQSGGRIKVDFQKTRASKNDPCSRYYGPDEFEVLAACLHPITEAWDFRFSRTLDLDLHDKCDGKLSHRVFVEGARWRDEVADVLRRP